METINWGNGNPALKVMQVVFNKNAKGYLAHHGAWMLVGTIYGLIAAPVFTPTCVLAFVLAGWIVCSVLSLLTVLTSKYAQFIVAGSLLALFTVHAMGWWQQVQPASSIQALCLFIGALAGATARMWEIPLFVFRQVSAAIVLPGRLQRSASRHQS